MDLVTVIAACAIGLRSELFVPLGMRGDCDRAAGIAAEPMHDPQAASIDRWSNEIAAASLRFGISERVLRAVISVESAGMPGITSPAGAMGLMQLMPETWATMRTRYRLGSDPYAPADNILAGAAFLRELIDRYGASDFLAAYNAGPARLEDHRLRGRALPGETRRYVAQLAAVAQDVPAAVTPPASAGPGNDNHQQAMAPLPSVPGSNAATPSNTATGLFAMDQNAGARRRVLADTPLSRNASVVPQPNTRNGGAIFAPLDGSTAAGPASATTLRTE